MSDRLTDEQLKGIAIIPKRADLGDISAMAAELWERRALDLTSEGEAAEDDNEKLERFDREIQSELTAPQPAQVVEMKRWSLIECGPDYDGLEIDPEGEWVKYTDAQAHIAALTAKVGNQKAAGYCDAQYLSDGAPFKCGWQHRAQTAEARVAQLEEALENALAAGLPEEVAVSARAALRD